MSLPNHYLSLSIISQYAQILDNHDWVLMIDQVQFSYSVDGCNLQTRGILFNTADEAITKGHSVGKLLLKYLPQTQSQIDTNQKKIKVRAVLMQNGQYTCHLTKCDQTNQPSLLKYGLYGILGGIFLFGCKRLIIDQLCR